MQVGSIAQVTQLARELRHALRRLVAAPAFTVFSIATLALAIGITTAVYTLVYHLMGQNYGVPDHAEVAGFYRGGYVTAVPIADFRDIQDQQSSFSDLAAWASIRTSLGMETSVLAGGEMVTGDYFRTLRIAARRGRIFTEADDRAGAPPVAMVGAWAADRWLGGQEDVVGRVVRIGGRPFTIVGVVDDAFRGMAGHGGPLTTTFWVPVSASAGLISSVAPSAAEVTPRDRLRLNVRVVARLRDGQSIAGASADIAAIGTRLDAAFPWPPGPGQTAARRDWSVGQAMPGRGASNSTAAAIIVGLPLLVFLIACTNLANLALSRSIARRNTLAVRHALGASRARLVREEMGEAVVIAFVGGVAGLGIARWLLTVTMNFIQAGTTIPVSEMLPDFTLSPAILGMTFGVTTLALVVGGLLPSLSLTGGNLREAMASGNDTALPRWRGRGNLIALQVGVSVGLLLVAISAARSFPDRLLWPGPGLEGLAVASIPFERQQYDEARAIDTLERITADARRVPGVEAVAVIAGLSARDAALTTNRFTSVTTPDRPFSDAQHGIGTTTIAGTPEMFDVLALQPSAGRTFGAEATRGGEPVAVVNEALALEVFGTAAATGRVLIVRTSTFQRPGADVATRVIGVVPNRRADRAGGDVAELYLPYAQRFDPNVAVLARGGDGVPPVAPLREAIRRVDPALATAFIGDGALVGATEATMLRGAVTIMNSLAAFALLLAMAGLYGVLSHVVSLRSRELAVRVALGASARRIGTMVLRDGLRPVAEGLALALVIAVIVRQTLRFTVADDLSAIDPIAFGIVTVLAGGCGLLACLLPSRRASRLDPNAILKDG